MRTMLRITDSKLLGLYLKRKRENLGYTMDMITESTGLAKTIIIKLEAGTGSHIKSLFRYMDALGVSTFVNDTK